MLLDISILEGIVLKNIKRIFSGVLATVMLITSVCTSFFAFAVTDLTSGYDLQIYYYNENNEFVEVTEQLSVMEQEDIQLYACLVYSDGTVWDITTSGFPLGMENYSIEWYSDARYLAFCENNDGKIHGYDATKGEAIRNWLNNEVATIPVVGESLKNLLLKMLDNDVTDIDDLDTEDVTQILDKALQSINVDEEIRNKLTTSLKEYLDKFDVGVSAILRDADGNELARDTIRLLVLKSDKFLSDVIPNAAFIKNYDSIPKTVAVGYEMDLEGIITPVRTHYTCTWTVTGSLGVLGSDLATVDENGHFTAIGEGTVQVKVSPDINGLTKKLSDAFEAMAAAGELVDNETIAKAILVILGIPQDSDNFVTLVSIITAIIDSGVITEDGTIKFGEEIMAPLANFILYVIYQDSVTITIVKPSEIPITSFELTGEEKLVEGTTTTLSFSNVKPDGAVPHDYTVEVENEEYAVQIDDLTFMGIDGSTWNNNYVTSNNTDVIVTMDGITQRFKLKVFANDNKKVVYIKINCETYLELDTPTAVDAVTYPKRLDSSLQYGWEYSDGTFVFAGEEPAYTEDGLAYVTSDGIMYSTGCTVNNIVVQEKNGAVQKKEIMSGIQTTGVEFTKRHFWKKSSSGTISTGIRGDVCEVTARILPEDASFNELTFTCADTESVILSATPLTNTQYASAALTEARRLAHKSATVVCDENGIGKVYAYAIGNKACYSDISVKTRTGGFVDNATVAFANISVIDVSITSDKDADNEVLVSDKFYQITAGEDLQFSAVVSMSEQGSWHNQGFEDVEWSIDNTELASIAQNGFFHSIDVGIVKVTATSVFEEMTDTVTVKILPDYRALKEAMANCDYQNLDPYDWSYDSWDRFDAYYQEAVSKLGDNSFVSQREVDELTENIISSFNGLVRYLPLTGISIYCSDDADGNGFATISVATLKDYTEYSSTIVPTVYPEEAEDYIITYTSSNNDKMTVDENGVCHPVSKKDSAWSKITVTVKDPKNGNEFSQEIYVAFAKYQVTSVSVDKASIHFVGVGEYAMSSGETITPSYHTSSSLTSASIKQGFFESSNEAVATVDDNGYVIPVGIGECEIIFRSYDGGHTAITKVSVTTNKLYLKDAIDRADALVEEFYTEESYADVQAALLVAKEQYNDENATQENINSATDSLNDALSKLVKNPYANVYISSSIGGSVLYEGELYSGSNNKLRVLIENGLTVKAVADEGYHFVCWRDANGNVISTNENDTFAIDYSAYFTAEFEKVNSVTGINAYVDGNDVSYYTVGVGVLSNYTKSSAKITYDVFPSNANFYRVELQTTSSDVNISSNNVVSPANNSTCYAVIDVVVTNTITGESFKDTVTVAFAKYKLKSVSANPTELIFNGADSGSQNIQITYNSESSISEASLKQGFFVSNDESVAVVDDNGAVIPRKIGNCTITFTAYDGGHTVQTAVKVYANKALLQEKIASVDSIVERNFTPESYANVINARDEAQRINAIEYASQESVDEALSNLQNAIDNLVELDLIDFDIVIEGNGSVSYYNEELTQSGSFVVKNGDEITLTATPNADNEFIGWYDNSGNLLSASLEYTVKVTGYGSLVARFNKLVYVESVRATADSNATEFYTYRVGSLLDYSKQSVSLGVQLNPSNPTHYSVQYSLGEDCNNLSINGSSISPSSNSNAYGTVYATVTDDSTGKTYTDSIVICFTKNTLKGISADMYDVHFVGENAESQLISISYDGGMLTPSTRRGFAEIDNSEVATVSTEIVDGVGTCMRVYPKSIGTTTAVFYAYDNGYSISVNIKVTADKSALKAVIERAGTLKAEDYTDESFSGFPDMISYAGGVFNSEFATQSEVDEATAGLNSAINALVLKDVITITVSSVGNGYAEINSVRNGSIKVLRGEEITINSVANDGYELEAWYDEDGNFVSNQPNMTFNADNAHTYIAKFKPIYYVERVVATVDGDEIDFYSKTGFSGSYANQSVSVGVNIYPSNAQSYEISYSLGKAQNMKLSGNTVKPTSNSVAYAQVIVTVVDNMSGKKYTDDIYVSFSKNQIKSVRVSPTNISFASRTDSTKTITPSYTLSHSSTTLYGSGIKAGFFVSSDERVAKVSDSGIVTPVGPGSCVITFYSYDAGRTATTNVTVGGTANLYGKVVAMNSPTDDSGSIGVSGATVTVGGISIITNEYGDFTLQGITVGSTVSGTVTYSNGVTRSFTVTANGDVYDIVIPIIAVDYVNDGIINAKDYGAMKKNQASDEMLNIFKSFVGSQRYSSSTYNEISF